MQILLQKIPINKVAIYIGVKSLIVINFNKRYKIIFKFFTRFNTKIIMKNNSF